MISGNNRPAFEGDEVFAIGNALQSSCFCHEKRAALIYKGETLSYGCLWRKTNDVAKGFLAMGIRKGTRVAILAPEHPNTLFCFYALCRLGAVAVLFNTAWGKKEVAEAVAESGATVLLYGDDVAENAWSATAYAAEEKTPPLRCVNIGTVQTEDPSLTSVVLEGLRIGEDELELACSSVRADDVATILFTSGTVGASKGVLNTHISRVKNAGVQAKDLVAGSKDRFCVAIPMFHCFSLVANILAAMLVGASVVLLPDRRTETILKTISEARCTVLHGVPTLFFALMGREDFKKFDLTALRIGLIGGAACTAERLAAIREAFAYELLPSLGMTEAGAGITTARPEDPEWVKLKTVGRFMDGVDGKILRLDGEGECAVGEAGEICVRGEQVMKGYCHADAAKVMDAQGYLHTGDLAYVDADGYVFLRGRIKEMVNRGGENIWPQEIEQCIAGMPDVLQVKVIGVPDAHYGEELCACVVAGRENALKPDDVRERVRGHLARYKVPRYVLFLERIPLTGSGKVNLKELKHNALLKLGLKDEQ